jgi:hypothetical protein
VFVADAVLLSVEGKSIEGGCQDVGVGACGMAQGPGANPEADIAKTNWGAARSSKVLAGA